MVSKDNRLSMRIGDGHAAVIVMARVLTTEAATVHPAGVYRTLFSEAMTSRRRACSRTHQGPIKDGACGHCGKATR